MRNIPINDIVKLVLRKFRGFQLSIFSLVAFLFCLVLTQNIVLSMVLALVFILLCLGYSAYGELTNEKLSLLSRMPFVRQEPTFVIDYTGQIVISMGPTKLLFKDKGIECVEHIFGEVNAERILKSAIVDEMTDLNTLDFFSSTLDKWYNVQLSPSDDGKHHYIWLVDITSRKRLDLRLSAIRRFSQDVVNNIDELTRKNDVYERLAKLMFQEGFSGFFIAKLTQDENLSGVAFKETRQGITQSNQIIVNKNSPVAVRMSQKTGKPFYANKDPKIPQNEFEQEYPFNPEIKQFLGFNIENFLNYHEGDTVIIGYNKANGVNDYDCLLIETVANTALTVSYLLGLSIAKAKIINDLEIAHETQRQLLPENDPDIPGLDISGMSQYCDNTGGDYYDYIYPVNFNERLFGMVVADVSGHGISAGLLMTATRALLRSRAGHNESVSKKLSILNHYLCQNTSESGNFVTMMLLIIDLDNKCIYWSRAGHEPVICYNPVADDFFELKGKGVALGFDKKADYEEYKLENISPGAIFLLATDGLWEARNEKGEMFGKDAVKKIIRDNSLLSAKEIKNLLYSSVTNFIKSNKLEDDLTIVVTKFD
jgi:serine phosphatase RsbU (regulator of sigma subunit)